MPLLDCFAFLRMGFDVAYHAAREPQLLHVEATMLERSSKRSAPLIVKRLIELINAGAASGSMFAPNESAAERVSGPWDGPDAFGPNFHWVLRVRGVAPLFLRTMVDQMRRCGHDQALTTLRIRGEAALTGGREDVDTKTMLAWLERADRYVDERAKPGFSVAQEAAQKTSFSITLAHEVSRADAEALKQLAIRWLIATAAYVDDDGKQVTRDRDELEKHLPRFETRGATFVARFEEFLHASQPSRAALVNLLAHAAAGGLAVQALQLSHPRFVQEQRRAHEPPAAPRQEASVKAANAPAKKTRAPTKSVRAKSASAKASTKKAFAKSASTKKKRGSR